MMKKNTIIYFLFIFFFGCAEFSFAQSSVYISYSLTYDRANQTYTVWLVPKYNTSQDEIGDTGQVTLAVPNGFTIINTTNSKGVWTPGVKLGPNQVGQNWTIPLANGIDPNTSYYTFGKSAAETNYGIFTSGTPIALFSFVGNGCFGPLRIIGPTDPIIQQINNVDGVGYLAMANSFTSRSGTIPGQFVEQFQDVAGTSPNCLIPLIATTDHYNTLVNQTITSSSILSNDLADGNPATTGNVLLTIASQPSHGTATLNSDGTITYVPATNYVGNDSYTYQICDVLITTNCKIGTVNLHITCPTISTPTQTLASPSSICPGQSVVLSANCSAGVLQWYSDLALTNPLSSSTVNPTQTTTYYAACLTLNGTCKSIGVPLSVTINNNLCLTDIQITKTVNTSSTTLGSTVIFTVTARNLGALTTSNIVVAENLGVGLSLLTATPSAGTWLSPNWTIPSLTPNQSATLTIMAQVTGQGVSTNAANYLSSNLTDNNSANNSASACVSVPIKICTGSSVTLTAPNTYTNVQWFQNNNLVGTGSTYQTSQAGTYTITASSSNCPAQGCCPVVVVNEDCCPPNLCLPLTVQKIN